jgi:hypothetical protein
MFDYDFEETARKLDLRRLLKLRARNRFGRTTDRAA